jgi:hypothetical protein
MKGTTSTFISVVTRSERVSGRTYWDRNHTEQRLWLASGFRRRCEQCTNPPTFGLPGSAVPTHCKEHRGEDQIEADSATRERTRCRLKERMRRDKKQTPVQFLANLVSKSRCTQNRRTSNGRHIEHTITTDDLVCIYDNQRGLCHLSGMVMAMRSLTDWMCSIERIDNTKGYTKDNVCLICFEMNTAAQWTASKLDWLFASSYTTTAIPTWDRIEATLNSAISSMLQKTRRRCRSSTAYNDAMVTITVRQLQSMFRKQQFRCWFSGVPLLFIGIHFRWSVERLNNTRGYHMDNCVLVCREFQSCDHTARAVIDVQGSGAWTRDKFMTIKTTYKQSTTVRANVQQWETYAKYERTFLAAHYLGNTTYIEDPVLGNVRVRKSNNNVHVKWESALARLESTTKTKATSKWITRQRALYRNGTLSVERTARLMAIPGWSWDNHKLARKYGKRWLHIVNDRRRRRDAWEGMLAVHVEGLESNTKATSDWAMQQRAVYRDGTLSVERAERIAAIPGWSWDRARQPGKRRRVSYDTTFSQQLEKVQKFYDEHGYTPTSREPSIGPWVDNRRQEYRTGRLHPALAVTLASTRGWSWDPPMDRFLQMVDELRVYVKDHGGQFPRHDKSKMGSWLYGSRKRKRQNTLRSEYIETLESIPGWKWEYP